MTGQTMSITEPLAAALPRNFLRPCVLLLLREQAGHGYDLLERLPAFGFTREDPGRLYRTLRALEQDDLVRSAWQPSSGGPDRRMYELTRAGREELHRLAKEIAAGRSTLDAFLSRYQEFVELSPPRPRPAREPS